MKNKYATLILTLSVTLLFACKKAKNPTDPGIDYTGNQPPMVYDDSYTTKMNQSITITVNGYDSEGEILTFFIREYPDPDSGNLSSLGDSNTFIFEPQTNFKGEASFVYVANDGNADSNEATISIHVEDANIPPDAQNKTFNVVTDETVEITLIGRDEDDLPSRLSYRIENWPSLGTLTSTADQRIYIYHAPDNPGTDSFTYVVNDTIVDSNLATVSINITNSNTNSAPSANGETIPAIDEDTLIVNHVFSASDPEGDQLSYHVDTYPEHGTVAINGSTFTYTPHHNYYGQDSFTFKVFDGSLYSDPAAIEIEINPVNDLPVASGNSYTIAKGETDILNFTLQASDAEDTSLTYTVNSTLTEGTITQASEGSPVCTFLLTDYSYIGPLTFDFYAADSDGGSSSNATITINVKDSEIIYVDMGNSTGPQNGESWATAFRHPQDAIDAALEGDVIWVAAGTYHKKNASHTAVITMKPGIEIFGGFVGTEPDFSHRNLALPESLTVLDGKDESLPDSTSQAVHVICAENLNEITNDMNLMSRIDGFTIRDGKAAGNSDGGFGHGGGIYISNSAPVIANCIFTNNQAAFGGAIYIKTSSTTPSFPLITISDCNFNNNKGTRLGFNSTENYDDGEGAAIYILADNTVEISNTIFNANRAYDTGGAISNFGNLTMQHIDFTRNQAKKGGALYDYNGANSVVATFISNCNFGDSSNTTSGNTASEKGGAIYNTGTIEVTDSNFHYNTAANPESEGMGMGGAIFNDAKILSINDSTLINYVRNIFVSNSSDMFGGAVYNYYSLPTITGTESTSTPAVYDCSLQNNSSKFGGAIFNEASSPEISNCSFTGNNVSAPGDGGAIYNYENTDASIAASTFQNNTATEGTSIYNFKSKLSIDDTEFKTNGTGSAINGALIYNKLSETAISNNSEFVNINSTRELILNTDESNLTLSDLRVYNTSGITVPIGCVFISDSITDLTVDVTAANLEIENITSSNGLFLNDNGSTLNMNGIDITDSTVNNAAIFSNKKSDTGISETTTLTINNLQIENTTFTNEIFLNLSGSTLEIQNGLIASNSMSGSSHAFRNDSSTMTVANSLINENSSSSELFSNNSASSALSIINCLIASNTNTNGGMILNANSGTLTVTNSTIAQNQYETTDSDSNTITTAGGGALTNNDATAVILNSIIWENIDPENTADKEISYTTDINDGSIIGSITVSYSCIDDADSAIGTDASDAATNNNNTNSDPQFITYSIYGGYPNYGNYYLTHSSPCIDFADPGTDDAIKAILADRISSLDAASAPVVDIILNEGTYEGTVDMGFHYEPIN